MVAKRALRGTEPLGYVRPTELPLCPLCARPMEPGPSVDEHHLIPRSHGGRSRSLIHRICHRKIHATFTERELAQAYNTWAALQAHPEMVAFIRWVAKKPLAYYDNSRKPARRR